MGSSVVFIKFKGEIRNRFNLISEAGPGVDSGGGGGGGGMGDASTSI